jgi:hypothetical protein
MMAAAVPIEVLTRKRVNGSNNTIKTRNGMLRGMLAKAPNN